MKNNTTEFMPDLTKEPNAGVADTGFSASRASNAATADPFDPTNLGISTDYATAINAQSSTKPFELRKPNDQEFFRTSEHMDQRLVVGAIVDKQEMGRVYVVSKALLKEVMTRFPTVRVVELVLAVTLSGTVLVWPVPRSEDRGGQWHSSQRAACDSGLRRWTNMAAGRGRYDTTTVDNPKSVAWEAYPPFCEILRQACSERLIETMGHPLLRKLAGETE